MDFDEGYGDCNLVIAPIFRAFFIPTILMNDGEKDTVD